MDELIVLVAKRYQFLYFSLLAFLLTLLFLLLLLVFFNGNIIDVLLDFLSQILLSQKLLLRLVNLFIRVVGHIIDDFLIEHPLEFLSQLIDVVNGYCFREFKLFLGDDNLLLLDLFFAESSDCGNIVLELIIFPENLCDG